MRQKSKGDIMKKLIFIILFVFLLPLSVSTTNYYVDATDGGDENAGTSAETAWQTASKVGNSSFSAGDSIFFQSGETWSETLTLSSVLGASGNHIVFSTYGTGRPIIHGDTIRTYGIDISDSRYITINNFEIRSLSRSDAASAGIWAVNDSNMVISNCYLHEIYYSENPGWGGGTGWEAQIGKGIGLRKCQDVDIHDNRVKHCGSAGITAETRDGITSSNINIYNNEVSNSNHGFMLAISNSTANSIIDGATVHDNYFHDFDPFYYSDAWHRNGYFSFGRDDNPSCIVRNVEIYNNFFKDNGNAGNGSTSWIYLSGMCTNFEIHHNVLNVSRAARALLIKGVPYQVTGNNMVCNNTIFNVWGANDDDGTAIRFEDSYNDTLYNNILVAGILAYSVNDSSMIGFDSDYNLLYRWGKTGDPLITFGENWYEFTQIYDSTGHDQHSVTGDPLFGGPVLTYPFANATTFRLDEDSGAIDVGTNLGYSTDYLGITIPLGINQDMGALEFYGNNYTAVQAHGDGTPYNSVAEQAYTTTRDASSSSAILTDVLMAGQREYSGGVNYYMVYRSALSFVIPTLTRVTACSLYVNGAVNNSNVDFNVYVHTSSYDGVISNDDYSLFNGRQTGGVHNGTVLNNTWNSSSYSDDWNIIVFNSAGLDSLLTAQGDTLRIMLISSEDFNNSAPSNDTREHISFDSSQDIGTEPYLSLTYSNGYTGTAMGVDNPASVLGVEKANLKNFLRVEF